MLKSDATRKAEQLEHLAQVRALSQAIASAMSAIEKNNLQEFQAHLAAQESLCNRLSATYSMVLSDSGQTARPQDAEDTEVQRKQEILLAHLELRQLNRVYGALLKRVRKSTELLATLYRSRGQGYNRGPSGVRNLHSWSCEV